MKKLDQFWVGQYGMTVLEVMITLGVLSVFFIGTLTLYSSSYKTIRTQGALLNILHDANLIMSVIGDDIHRADSVLKDYESKDSQTVIATMKIPRRNSGQAQDTLILYALDTDQPNRLIRIVETANKRTSVEMSTHIQKLELLPKTARLFEVRLILEESVAGKVTTLQTSSAYALRY